MICGLISVLSSPGPPALLGQAFLLGRAFLLSRAFLRGRALRPGRAWRRRGRWQSRRQEPCIGAYVAAIRLRKATRDGHRLLLTRAQIRGVDVDDAVGVDV